MTLERIDRNPLAAPVEAYEESRENDIIEGRLSEEARNELPEILKNISHPLEIPPNMSIRTYRKNVLRSNWKKITALFRWYNVQV